MDIYNYLLCLKSRLRLEQMDAETKNFIKGLEGEQQVENILKQVDNLSYCYNLSLNLKNRIQIDFLVITDQIIYHFEVKNYSSDYTFQDGYLSNDRGNKFNTPFQQLDRANQELNEIITHYNINRELKSYLIFPNSTFTLKLMTAPSCHLLLPTELHKLPKLFRNFKTKENRTILQIFENNRTDFSSIYNNIKSVPFEYIRGGLKCPNCKEIDCLKVNDKYMKLQCTNCLGIENRQYVYLYNLKELYFCKGEPFTVSEAEIWCRARNRDTIRRVCDKYFKVKGKKPKKYYLDEL
nr:nuclease-related domain-containing protein [Mammaliicoccus sp. Marseille-Q6498]